MAEIEQTLDELRRVYRLNIELLENLRVTIMWIGRYSQKTGQPIPDLETLSRLMREATRLAEEIDSPLVPSHSFIKPLKPSRLLTERDRPPDKLPVYSCRSPSCSTVNDRTVSLIPFGPVRPKH